ncbi:hypothetical protein [Singulisphaera sp. PoT]|uniref:hypothetical protein n=1 Tax=Singulisphaera sp. PoT TaxID=3411797 RepID=UPI003BF5E59C
MKSCPKAPLLLLAAVMSFGLGHPRAGAAAPAASDFHVEIDHGHPWRPPFGLDRVGPPISVVIESTAKPPLSKYELTAFYQGKEVDRQDLKFAEGPKFAASVTLKAYADELVISASKDASSPAVEVAREKIQPAAFVAEAVAHPDSVINPVDLGTILVPADWLLLGPKSTATVEVAALSRVEDFQAARVKTWYASNAQGAKATELGLKAGTRSHASIPIPPAPSGQERDALVVAIEDGHGKELWRKSIPVMAVAKASAYPKFGATATQLRFDAPISVRDPASGQFSSLPYNQGWNPALKDVVISLPNGSRFVFWRGSSYIPFWAGRYNTGACYEWAEMISRPKDAVDCVEPLMDKDLRYGRVEIIESTPAHVHVRWSYQSTDLHYQVWGDSAVEDYHFYPDGFGTRVVTLTSDPKAEYELAEFIVLSPQDAYPLATLPENLVDALFLDGAKREFRFPHKASPDDAKVKHGLPAVYRLRLNKQEELSAISFNPKLDTIPTVIFSPFFDAGQMVTPCYWGSHWPLARGNATGNAIDDRIHLSPCHNSVMSWAAERPTPLRSSEYVGLDALGRSRLLAERRWVWLVGMSNEPDDQLVARARSYSTPPSLALKGARLADEAYVPERRSIRLMVDAPKVSAVIQPSTPCINPVFELEGAAKGPIKVSLGGRPLEEGKYAWDGRTLWLDATITAPTELQLSFR